MEPKRETMDVISSIELYHPILKSNQKVRFNIDETTTINDSFCPSFEDGTSCDEEADIRTIQNNNENLIKKYRALIRINPSLSGNKEHRTSTLAKQRKLMNEELRGLEDHLSTLSSLLYKRRVAACCQGVLNEQLRQKNLWKNGVHNDRPFILDSELVRKVSANNSMKSKMMAYSFGLADAAYVSQAQQHDVDHQVESVFDHNQKGIVPSRSLTTPKLSLDNMALTSSIEQSAVTKRTTTSASSVLRHHVLRQSYSSKLSSDVRMTVV
jgi:hypothetical protein